MDSGGSFSGSLGARSRFMSHRTVLCFMVGSNAFYLLLRPHMCGRRLGYYYCSVASPSLPILDPGFAMGISRPLWWFRIKEPTPSFLSHAEVTNVTLAPICPIHIDPSSVSTLPPTVFSPDTNSTANNLISKLRSCVHVLTKPFLAILTSEFPSLTTPPPSFAR